MFLCFIVSVGVGLGLCLACMASDSISEDSSLQAEQIVELEGVLWFVGIVLASRVEYQRKSSLYQSPNGSI